MDIPIPNFSIRLATELDGDEIARLLSLLGHATSARDIVERWPQWAADNSALVAIAHGNTLSGVATLHQMLVLHRPKPVGRITALIVNPDHRGQGIGRALVAASEELLVQKGCRLVEITSNSRLVDAHLFYEHLGYERTSFRFAKILVAST